MRHEGKRPGTTAASQSLQRLVVGLGSGQMGFESASLDSDGHLEVVLLQSKERLRYTKASTLIDPKLGQPFLKSQWPALCSKLYTYTADIWDGTQGFIHVGLNDSHRFIYCDNAFPAEYKKLWNDMQSLIKSIAYAEWYFTAQEDGYQAYREGKKLAGVLR